MSASFILYVLKLKFKFRLYPDVEYTLTVRPTLPPPPPPPPEGCGGLVVLPFPNVKESKPPAASTLVHRVKESKPPAASTLVHSALLCGDATFLHHCGSQPASQPRAPTNAASCGHKLVGGVLQPCSPEKKLVMTHHTLSCSVDRTALSVQRGNWY